MSSMSFALGLNLYEQLFPTLPGLLPLVQTAPQPSHEAWSKV